MNFRCCGFVCVVFAGGMGVSLVTFGGFLVLFFSFGWVGVVGLLFDFLCCRVRKTGKKVKKNRRLG